MRPPPPADGADSRRPRGRLVAAALGLALLALPAPVGAADWERVYSADDLMIDTRSLPASAVKELRAEGALPAPPHVVRAVIADVERYPEFMPYVKVARVLEREMGGAVVVYQRLAFGALSLLGVADRDYTIRIVERVTTSADGSAGYLREWSLVEAPPPSDDGSVIHVPVNKGYWHLRAAGADARQTTAVYCLFTDPGGSLPTWAVNRANTLAVPKVFEAVRTAARDPRYARQAPPPAPPDSPAPREAPVAPCATR